MPWLDNKPPLGITVLKRRKKTRIKWETISTDVEMDKADKYVVYVTEKGTLPSKTSNADIYTITKDKEIRFDRINKKKKKYEVRISVLDRLNNESVLSLPITIKL